MKLIEDFKFEDTKIYSVDEYKNINENYKPNSAAPVLGIVEGKSFVLDGVSQNGRFYPKKLWENALNDGEVLQMLQNKLMFGCIGHPENYTLDELLADGKVSHIVTDLRLGNDGFGYATYEILDTPSGRILNTVLRAGSKLNVSTRAFGEFANESKTIDGRQYRVIDPKSFKLESIDFVIKPGVASVDVSLVEKLEKENKKDLEKLKESKIVLCEDGACNLIEEVELHQKIKEEYEKEIQKYKKIIETLKEENKELADKVTKDSEEDKEENFDKLSETEIRELLIAEIENYLKKISVLKNRKEVAEKFIEFLEAEEFNSEQVKDLKEELEKIKSNESDTIKALIERLLEILEEKKKDNKDLMGLKDDIGNVIKQEELNKVKEEYEFLISNYKQVIKDLAEKFSELEKERIEVNSLTEKLNKLEEENANSKQVIKSLTEKLESAKKKYNEILNNSNKEKDTFKETIKNLKSEIKSLKENYTELEFQYKSIKENFEVKTEKAIIEKLKETEKDYAKKLKESEISIKEKLEKQFEEKLETKTLELEMKLKESEKEISTLNKNKEMLEKQLKEIKSSSLNEENEIKKIEESFNKKLNEMNVENKSLKEDLENYKLQYLKTLYPRLSESEISSVLNNSNSIEKVKEILDKKESKVIYNMPEHFNNEELKVVKKPKETILAEKLL